MFQLHRQIESLVTTVLLSLLLCDSLLLRFTITLQSEVKDAA